MDLKLEIICENYKHKKIKNNKILVDKPSEEYYIIPLSKSCVLESDEKYFKLTFNKQLLWLKYSNHKKEILLKEYDFKECIIIESKDIFDIYVKIQTGNYFRKNVWNSKTTTFIKKKYDKDYFLVLPIFDDMIEIEEFGEGVKINQINMITNEILLKQAKKNGNSAVVMVTNNFTLNQEALYIRLNNDEIEDFIG